MMNSKLKNILVIIFFLIGIGLVSTSVIIRYNTPKEEPKKEEKKEEKKKSEEKELTDEDVIKSIDEFYKVINSDKEKFSKIVLGTTCDDETMLAAALKSINMNEKYTLITNDNVNEKYKEHEDVKSYIPDECIIEISKDVFDKELDNMFGKKIKYNLDKLNKVSGNSCITIYDEKLKIMYYNRCTCGDAGSNRKLYMKPYKYSYDDDHYYMYVYTGIEILESNNKPVGFYGLDDSEVIDVEQFEGNEDKFITIRWIFDKNVKFVNSSSLT